jgi:hypothetical protein
MLWCCVVVWTLGIRAAEAMSECVRGVSVITGTMGSAVVEKCAECRVSSAGPICFGRRELSS